ncbi:hypothetical protein RND81_05G141600 [Saponaria officinalis]|uniref:KAT8 regulatory NSL complex subunit 2 n=1 Tax=Saponaria officinalis TaxID=3572 RepID=A0AAW1KY40_SAPOF
MASSSTPNHHTTTLTTTTTKRKPPSQTPSSTADTLLPSQEDDLHLSTSSHLTRDELLRRRLYRTRKLSRVYRHHFWSLMEDLRAKYRLYYWKYGVSPFSLPISDDPQARSRIDFNGGVDDGPEDCGETNAENGGGFGKLGLGFGESNYRCAYSGCKFKAMALTNFCHMHILSDPHQMLYKPCNFVIKNTDQGQILCERPILSSAVPSLCNVHLPKLVNDVKQALKKAVQEKGSSKA